MTPWAREDESDLEELLADGNRYRRRLNQEHHENLVGCAFFDLLAPQYGLERVPEAVTKSVGKRHGEAMRLFQKWCADLKERVGEEVCAWPGIQSNLCQRLFA